MGPICVCTPSVLGVLKMFTLGVQDPSLYGMMIYHRNRLIRPYHRVGMQLEANEKGVGVLGVVQADYLEPTHNKQVDLHQGIHFTIL